MTSKIAQEYSEPTLSSNSKLKKISFVYHWTVEKFADFVDRKYEIPSRKFMLDIEDGTEWNLVLSTKHTFPQGAHLAVSLVKLSDNGKSHGIIYNISLISDYSVHHFKQSREKIFKHFMDFDECVIVSHDELFAEKMILSKRRPDLLIRCEIDMLTVKDATDCNVSSKDPTVIINNLSPPKLFPAADNDVRYRNEIYSSTFKNEGQQGTSHVLDSLNCLSNDFCSLYKNQDLTDITLICEGASLRAHKAVLSARSEVFRNASIDDQIKISGIKYTVVEAMLYYMYTGKTRQLTVDMAVDMLYAAKKFKLDHLRNLILDFLKSTTAVNVENVPQLTAELKDVTKLVELNFFK